MARYANGSLEKALLLDLKAHDALDKRTHGAERRNPKRINAHKANEADIATHVQRVTQIRAVLYLLDRGYVRIEVALGIIHKITKGE